MERSAVVHLEPIVLIHAHPDDETLSTGALLATCALAGRPVTVVTCTRGERGEVLTLPGTASAGLAELAGDPTALGDYRSRELAAALAALSGAARPIEHHFLDELPGAALGVRYCDSGMRWVAPGVAGVAIGGTNAVPGAVPFSLAPLRQTAEPLAQLLAARQPAAVVTYDADGGYGHPDHVRARLIVEHALTQLRSANQTRARLWEIAAPPAQRRAALVALAADPGAREYAERHGLTFRSLDEPSTEAIAPEADPQHWHEVPVSPVLHQVLAALRCYSTQVQHATPGSAALAGRGVLGWFATSNGVLLPIRAREVFRLVSED